MTKADLKNETLIFKRLPPDLILAFKLKCVTAGKKQRTVFLELLSAYTSGTEIAQVDAGCTHKWKGGVCTKCYIKQP